MNVVFIRSLFKKGCLILYLLLISGFLFFRNWQNDFCNSKCTFSIFVDYKHKFLMKKTLFLLLCSFNIFAQNDLRNTIEEYLRVVETKNSERIMDYMYPKFFELFARDLMVKTLDQSMQDPSLEILLMDSKVLDISDLKTVDSVTYSKVGYSFVMTLKYVASYDNPLPDDDAIAMTDNIFKETYGAENVSFNNKEKKFRIFAKKEMLVLKTPSLKEWKVLGVENNLKPMLMRILPSGIIADL